MKQDESKTAWSIELGFYPGVLFGIRSYEQETESITVLYIPFVDIAFIRYY